MITIVGFSIYTRCKCEFCEQACIFYHNHKLYTRSREGNKINEDLFLERTFIDVSDMTKLKYEKMVMKTGLT